MDRPLAGLRPAVRPVVLGLLALALVGSPLAAQLPRRIDCGDFNGFPTGEPGWELLTETGSLSGVSLSPAPLDTVHVGQFFGNPFGGEPLGVLYPVDVLACDPDLLEQSHRLTALQLEDFTELTFAGLAPQTPYRVRLELGALFPWTELIGTAIEFFPTLSRDLRVEARWGAQWRTAAHGLRAATGLLGNTLDTDASGIVSVWVVARTDAGGSLHLRLSTDGADPVLLAGVELHEHEALPVVYRRTGAGPPLEAQHPALAAFVAAFDPADLGAAESAALALADPFHRGVALAHLLGWLDGSQAGHPVHLRAATRSALGEAAPTHPAAAWLLDELHSFERALDHLAAAGYEWAQRCPDEGGFGFLNADCGDGPMASAYITTATANANAHIALRELAGLVAPADGPTVLHDLVDWNASQPAQQPWEPSPFVFAAAKLTAATLADLNPLLSTVPNDPESGLLLDLAAALFDAFESQGFAELEAPRDLELRLFRRMLELDLHPRNWSVAELQALYDEDELAQAWWGPFVTLQPDDAGAPLWANLQRDHRSMTRALVDWWLTERLVNHELGGGWGDDVELMAQLVQPLGGFRDQRDRRALDAFDELARFGLEEQGLVQDGYYAGSPTDAQHNAEFTTNPWLVQRVLSGFAPRTLQTALGVMGHLRDEDDPATAFAGLSNLGRLHFRSYVYTAAGPSDDPDFALDRLHTGRTLVPGLGVAYGTELADDHPMLADLGLWAEALRLDALDTNQGKPLGWFAPTRWPSNAFGLPGAAWYSESSNVADSSLFKKGLHAYGLEGLRLVAERELVNDAWRHLVPAVRVFRTVMDWEDAGEPGGAVGSDAWIAAAFRSGSRFGPLVVAYVASLRDEPRLRTEIDPLTGQPYIDDAFIARMQDWVEEGHHGQTNALRYALRDPNACGAGPVKPTNSLWAPYENWRAYARTAWPLFTRHVLRTDRAFLESNGGGHDTLVASATGDLITDGLTWSPLLSWESRLDDGLDLAFQLNDRPYDGAGARSWVHSFEAAPVALALRLESGLAPGRYQVSWAPADDGCDGFPPGSTPASSVVDKHGGAAAVLVVLEPGLNLVQVERLGAAPAAVPWELSADMPSVEIRAAPGSPTGWQLAFTTRVANRGTQASPDVDVDWFASFLGPDGELLIGEGLDAEIPLGTTQVAGLPALDDWELPVASSEIVVPLTSSLATWLVLGQGLQVRVVASAGGTEGDTVDNVQTRGWYLPQMAIVVD